MLADVLKATVDLSTESALVVESLAYSTLLAGPDFGAWRAGRASRALKRTGSESVRLERLGDALRIELHRPDRHNAFNAAMRDSLVAALEVAAMDPSVAVVNLVGAGPSFCSGGDLDEFGTTPDVVTAYQLRCDRSPGLLIHQMRDRVVPTLHGACIGAGIEIPAFAAHVRAHRSARFALPELRMGLIPGAGGTVSISRRIGRERTLEWALSGEQIGVETALEWGLVDELV